MESMGNTDAASDFSENCVKSFNVLQTISSSSRQSLRDLQRTLAGSTIRITSYRYDGEEVILYLRDYDLCVTMVLSLDFLDLYPDVGKVVVEEFEAAKQAAVEAIVSRFNQFSDLPYV